MHPAHPLPNSYWVTPRLLAGPSPSSADREQLKDRLGTLIRAGVRCFIDLTVPAEIPAYRVPLERLIPAGDESAYVNIPILNGMTPGSSTMEAILDLLDANHRRTRTTYVHCLGGLGRTGVVVACYMIRHGLATADDVVRHLADLRRGEPHGDRASPESPSQYAQVRSWTAGR
jgi:Cyclin-dependent kinase inhibitor 3 (CDKN3)